MPWCECSIAIRRSLALSLALALTIRSCYISHYQPAGSVRQARSSFDSRPVRRNAWVMKLADPDLNFLARQNERILTEIASLRDDMAVLTAMVMRLDGSHAALLQETRATHAQITRMNDRIRKLEAGGEVT
jgi:hypothetical protein